MDRRPRREPRRPDPRSRADALTGISNRRGFELLSDHTLRVAARNQLPVALIFFDLDHFKRINDSLGHAEGDAVLVEVAKLLLVAFRDSDVVARMGGDEFAVLMSAIAESDIKTPLERLAQRIAERNASVDPKAAIQYSAGIVTDSMEVPRTAAELLAEADRRMYEQKRERHESD